MWKAFRKIGELLEPQERWRALLLLALILLTGIGETLGVASIMPFVAVLADPSVVETNSYLSAAYAWLKFKTPEEFLFFLGLVVLLAFLGSIGLRALTVWAIARFSYMRRHTLSRRLFAGYINRPYTWFLGRHSGNLGTTVLSEADEVVTGALVPALHLIAQGFVVLLLVTLLMVIDPFLAVTVSVVLGGAYGLVFWMCRRFLDRMGKERVRANRERFRISIESFGGIKDVKLLGLENAFLRRFEKPSRRIAQFAIAKQVLSQMPQFALQAIAFSGILLVLQYLLVVRGSLAQALPIIALYAVAGSRLLPALQRLFVSFSALRAVMPALRLVHKDLVGQKMDHQNPSPSTPNLKLHQLLELRGVCYRYPKSNQLALKNVTLEIPARSTVGLVGKTGAGKTTVADLILGLLEPDGGELLVDGTPIREHNKRAWQRCAGYVPQNIFLSDDSIAANIAFGIPRSEIDLAAVERATRLANLHNFVVSELKNGYDTTIGERGVRLSGGQRQRIGIARALYHDPDILIMDEATSALDNVTERVVMDAVSNLRHRKTIILVAHRLTTVKRCDLVFMLERGCLVGSGTYDQLVAGNERFRAMVQSPIG